MSNKNTDHQPVLLEEILNYLAPQKGESYLDVTAGYGGHATAILARTGAQSKATLIDRDGNAVAALREKIADAQIIHQDYFTASNKLAGAGKSYDIILADLGTSSPHLDRPERGFAIYTDGPLDMRMDVRQDLSAAQIVNEWDEAMLEKTLSQYGQEPRARRIAKAIVKHRPINTTRQLAKVIADAAGWRSYSKKHPATKTFQALRIAVNDELSQLEQSLPLWVELLAPGGRLAIISFHSLEDKIVKDFLAENAGPNYDQVLRPLTKKPVTGSKNEIAFNPRARSAKLRAAVKIKTK